MQAGASALAAVLVVFAAACGEDSTGPVFEVITEVSYADEYITAQGDTLTVDLAQMTETESGVYIQDLLVGVGDTAVVGDTMFVQYTGWLRDATEFDSGSFQFIFGDGSTAIGGFHFGTQGQLEGGSRLVIIPPEWAYGALSLGPVYPGAILLFETVVSGYKSKSDNWLRIEASVEV
jgi:peptidylprolyl isomerase